MIVKVSLFAAAKDVVGSENVEVQLDDGATVAGLKKTMVEKYPTMKGIVEKSAFAVDQEYANDSKPLYDGADVGLIPPVSGG